MKRAVVTVGLLALVAVGAGCQDKTRESTKREQDRLAMQLATAESARDEARSSLDKAQNDAELSRQRVAALEKELAEAKQQSAAAAESQKQVEALQSKLKESEAALAVSEEEVATQTTRAKELEAQLAKQPEAVKTTTPPASTQPAQEFNK